ncbi:MAG: hypothetical protein PHX44_09440 [Sulfurimonas sp.]|nr:hypothetical protein [Sulfurimonas sp.]MDD2653258.1 hypothetical protein [Sulfurimonas sp.]MDD3452136.1 hypothetical protein [Sulfurimonas sp.]
MVGNAVPPNLAYYLAKKIALDVKKAITLKEANDRIFSNENRYTNDVRIMY